MVVCSATAVDWLGDVSSGATVYSQRRPSDDGGGAKGGDGDPFYISKYNFRFSIASFSGSLNILFSS